MAGGIGAYPEHHFRRTIPGDIEAVRKRLSQALEDFGYIVINENPIQAKRPRQKNFWVAMISDYDTALTIGLKSISPASTTATFEYATEMLFTRAEKQALEREAEAIIALTTAASVEAFCPSCGIETAGAVRFCRSCGKPIARHELPAEIEVARLAASASGAQIEITLGLAVCLLSLITTLPLILSTSDKATVFGWILFALSECFGAFYLMLGMRRLHKALNSINPAQQETQSDAARVTSMKERAALPPQPASITEGTTELIDSRQPVPTVVEPGKDTGSMQ